MKESITKFDLEAAFKALDDIEIPATEKGIKANRPALTEIFSRKSKFDALMEEYYDISNQAELTDAKEAREAEVAKAKLARIEKIVDLEAESPEDLLTSYVGKLIMQCPQCMTLFYKNPEDVEESEEDPSVVNVNEVCQHCGNEAGYTLVGKVGEATPEETAEANEEETFDVTSTEEGEEASAEEPTEEPTEEESSDNPEEGFNLDSLDLELEDTGDSEKKEEAFISEQGEQVLVEDLREEAEVEVTADEFEDLINSPEFKKPMSDVAARAMMSEFSDSEAVKEELTEAVKINNETLKYAVINSDGTYAGVPCTSEEEAKDLAAQQEGRIIVKLEEIKAGKLNESKELELPELVEDSISHLVNDLGKDPEDENFAEEVIIDIENNYDTPIPTDPIKYIDWASSIACEVSRQLNNVTESLTEGGLGTLGKTIGKKFSQGFKSIKNKVSDAIDKYADKAKTRDEKADWVLASAQEDYGKAKFSAKNELVPDENNKRFNVFVIIGYTDKYSNGKTITMAPSYNNKDLIIGKNGVQEKKTYKEADSIAKGWSMEQGNGPAFIYLAKNKDDPDAVFLCEYFQGELENDNLEKYFTVVKKHLEGAKLMADGGMSQTDEGAASEYTPTETTSEAAPELPSTDSYSEKETKEILVSDLKVGMEVYDLGVHKKVKDDGQVVNIKRDVKLIGKVTNITQLGDIGTGCTVGITVQNQINKSVERIALNPKDNIFILTNDKPSAETTTAKESLNTIISNLEELHEASLESYISDSLVEAYGNVAGFRLTDCEYLDESFNVNGTIYFSSGKARKTTYSFTEAYNSCNNEIKLYGTNKKLGTDKQFVLVGRAENKTLITESFKYNKK